jgi:hypothetical protein
MAELPALAVEELLHENMLLISAIHECRVNGHDEQGSQYALRLHKNLMTVSAHMERQKTDRLRQQQEQQQEQQQQQLALRHASQAQGQAQTQVQAQPAEPPH